jgi:hypothetical protein
MMRAFVVLMLAASLVPLDWTRVEAADLTAETVAGWNRYVARTEARIARELAGSAGFLAFDREADAAAIRRSLLRGTLVIRRVQPASEGAAVPDGAIHHWRAAVLVPGITIERLVAALRDPARHGYRPPDVLEWRLLERRGSRERVFLQIQRREIVTAVFNTEHEVEFATHGPGRISSRSLSTRIAEVADHGTPRASEKRVGSDRGFLWRLNSYWRYEAVRGGVLVELESLSLSRSVPALLAPVARPLIARVARESIERTLAGIRDQLGRPTPGAAVAAPAYRLAPANFVPKKSPSFQAGRALAFATSRPMSRFNRAKSTPA